MEDNSDFHIFRPFQLCLYFPHENPNGKLHTSENVLENIVYKNSVFTESFGQQERLRAIKNMKEFKGNAKFSSLIILRQVSIEDFLNYGSSTNMSGRLA